MQSHIPVPLSEAQSEQAGALLARAFHNNPLLAPQPGPETISELRYSAISSLAR